MSGLNEPIGNSIHPFVLGQKTGSLVVLSKGVKASANFYCLIEMAKANHLEPYHYLRCLFNELPNAVTVEDIEALLPDSVSLDQIII